jgi:quinol monooxygenase YgiN
MEQYVDAEALERHRNASYILETAPLHAEYFAEPPTLQYLDVLVAN